MELNGTHTERRAVYYSSEKRESHTVQDFYYENEREVIFFSACYKQRKRNNLFNRISFSCFDIRWLFAQINKADMGIRRWELFCLFTSSVSHVNCFKKVINLLSFFSRCALQHAEHCSEGVTSTAKKNNQLIDECVAARCVNKTFPRSQRASETNLFGLIVM